MWNGKFTSKQIFEITSLKINTLHYYIKAGIITPDVEESAGTGTSRYFSSINLMEASILIRLIRFGIPKRTISIFFQSIKKERDFLNPQKILKAKGNIFLYFLTDAENSKLYHVFYSTVTIDFKPLDFNDYSLCSIAIVLNLTTIALV